MLLLPESLIGLFEAECVSLERWPNFSSLGEAYGLRFPELRSSFRHTDVVLFPAELIVNCTSLPVAVLHREAVGSTRNDSRLRSFQVPEAKAGLVPKVHGKCTPEP